VLQEPVHNLDNIWLFGLNNTVSITVIESCLYYRRTITLIV